MREERSLQCEGQTPLSRDDERKGGLVLYNGEEALFTTQAGPDVRGEEACVAGEPYVASMYFVRIPS